MAWGDPGSATRAWERAKSGGKKGAVTGGLWGTTLGGVGAIPGAVLGGLGGMAAGALGWGAKGGGGTDITATDKQTAAFERENQLRQEAIQQARGMGGAAARGAAQQGALAYGGAGMAPAGGGRLAGLRDVGMGAEQARGQAALEATIFEQEASPEAARQKKMAWLTQQMESLRAAGRLTPEAIQGLMPMAGGDPQVVAFLNAQAGQAPGKSTLLGDVGNIVEYAVGFNPLDRS